MCCLLDPPRPRRFLQDSGGGGGLTPSQDPGALPKTRGEHIFKDSPEKIGGSNVIIESLPQEATPVKVTEVDKDRLAIRRVGCGPGKSTANEAK